MADFFWTDRQLDPKRAYRFIARFTQTGMAEEGQYFIKTVQKPGIEIAAKDHMYLGHKFFYPGIVSWNPNPIEIKMVDPVEANSNTSNVLTRIIEGSGYVIPKTAQSKTTISKQKAVNALQGFTIQVINADGVTVESWSLQNPFIKSVKFGDLDYSKDDLTDVTIQLQYDWCEFTLGEPGSGGGTFSPK